MEGAWMICVVSAIYLTGELGHYLIGVVSRTVAEDLHYGSMACFPNFPNVSHSHCSIANSTDICESLVGCRWDYSGLGMDYQLLAGPSFMAVFTIAGVLWGIAADRCNRVVLLSVATFTFSCALALTALSTTFWHLVFFRALLGVGVSGCCPLAAGMICDTFDQKVRGKAMSFYNCGMYVGYGLSYAVGIYVTKMDIFGMGWRATFILCGIPGIIMALLLLLTVKNPEAPPLQLEDKAQREEASFAYESMNSLSVNREYDDLDALLNDDPPRSQWRQCFTPIIILLVIAASLRRSAGYTLRYNSALYFQVYYPNYDVGWWLTAIYCIGGCAGSLLGGITSDRLVTRLGVSARAVVLAVGQLIATPFAFGLLYLDPPYAFIPQSIGYLFGAMWFGALFTILVEVIPPTIRSSAFGVCFFVMENVGGNFPIIVEYLTSFMDYRSALAIMYPGELLLSSGIFFICYFLLRGKN